MANTINDLYLKYVNKVGRTLESDRYFQYLYEMVQSGQNVLQQKNQVMHKVVDERWLATIEESLDAINTIIEKPRRFVTTTEEIVPVALAKKITADSVRHLSMNTQFIASSEDGDIQPTKVLNISTEESYDLYENRFIYHLIQRLVTFIDKRTDVIFWATEDEKRSTLSYQSKVDDAYEEIEYKIEMTIKNRQSYAENDADNLPVFMRIDRVRRMVMALKSSPFCGLMAGCSKVRSPIQRTNLIMKDPYYRTCYKLWQFLESYDEVGYTIEVRDSALEFDEEYLLQMYTNLITNYTVFKSLLEDDRRLEEVEGKKRRIIKPKFIKKIEEEIVDNRDLPDVEIRQVFIEEVTQAQLDAEAKLAEETEARKQAEKALDEMDSQMIDYQQQISNLLMMNQDAEVRAEAEKIAKEEAEQKIAEATEAKEAAEAEILAAKTAAEESQKAKEEMEAKFLEMQRELMEAKEAAKAAETLKQEADERAALADVNAAAARNEAEESKKLAEEMKQTSEETKREAEAAIAETKREAEAAIAEAKQQADSEIQKKEQSAEEEIIKAKKIAAEEINKAKKEAEETVDEVRNQTRTIVNDMKLKADEQIASLQKERDELSVNMAKAKEESDRASEEAKEALKQKATMMEQRDLAISEREKMEGQLAIATEQAKDSHAKAAEALQAMETAKNREKQAVEAMEEAKKQAEEERQRADEEAKARVAAEAKAEANTLSHYIISAINGRKQKNNDSDKDEE